MIGNNVNLIQILREMPCSTFAKVLYNTLKYFFIIYYNIYSLIQFINFRPLLNISSRFVPTCSSIKFIGYSR